MTEQHVAAAGWYPDSDGTHLRWWDGTVWTAHVAPAPDTKMESAFVAERRRVYSHEMLYVADVHGVKVGRVNLGTGKVTMDLPDRRAEFDACVARWQETNSEPETPA